MTKLWGEPALVIGAVGTALALAIAFGAPLTEQQTQAVLAFIGGLIPIIAAIVTRSQVTPTVEADAAIKKAARTALNHANNLPPQTLGWITCLVCHGTGFVPEQAYPEGEVLTTCSSCGGTGLQADREPRPHRLPHVPDR